eukprot:TRINITY_DN474_c0_g1_i1.p1 TRINITY_DN474_c0_g1~~TRINITY_DN474_c0_g1_i1.p1  ORF type:complete len:229 (+),score=77.95 TRINITY_DN474_c0_g1_i1:68-754(+)
MAIQFADVVGFLLDTTMVVGAVIGYVFQYRDIKKDQSAEGFSLMIPFILLISNILRVFFWWGKQFETALLIQSIVMIAAQLVLLELCTRYPQRGTRGHKLTEFNMRHFWQWEDFASYVTFLAAFVSGLLTLSTLFISQPWYVEFLGYAALLIESTLGIPQWVKNQMTKSTAGLSGVLIITWFAGDAFKTIYFISKAAPFQFILCGSIQLTVDILVLFQILTLNPPRTI